MNGENVFGDNTSIGVISDQLFGTVNIYEEEIFLSKQDIRGCLNKLAINNKFQFKAKKEIY